MLHYDVIIVGGGHAGTEAASSAARMGARTLLVTQRLDRIGELSCNPSIGGIGKGHLVREIDALDGIMGRAADQSGIHFKLLNRSKGPAVRGLRAQVDRFLYRQAVQSLLRQQTSLELMAGEVCDLIVEASGAVRGVLLADGRQIHAGAVVITTGTFLRGVIHTGHRQSPAGRVGEAPSIALAERFAALRLPVGRLKTGTPPRLARDSIDWESLEADWGDVAPEPFSFMSGSITQPQIDCRVTGTTEETHRLVIANLGQSAMHGGAITGRGPRYCPSLEDKVVRFSDRSRHQIFLEPEGLPGTEDGEVVYPNGISTSLPADIQAKLLRTIPGLRHARIIRPGYAVEYDFIQPTALTASLEVAALPRLFLAGQINGTTGYEEAAAQGVLAGINAATRAGGGAALHLDRATSYIGVLVDDLTTQGVTEPYRIFTSRAEFRLSLRCDNADLRLTPIGIASGCITPARAAAFAVMSAEMEQAERQANLDTRTPSQMAECGIAIRQDGEAKTIFDALVKSTDAELIARAFPWFGDLSSRVQDQLATTAMYGGYIVRQKAEMRQLRANLSITIPEGLDFSNIAGLGTEACERLSSARPTNLAALANTAGITPAATLAVMAHLRRAAG